MATFAKRILKMHPIYCFLCLRTYLVRQALYYPYFITFCPFFCRTKPVTREFVDVCREESSKDIFQKRKSDEKTTAKAITKAMYDGFLVLYSDESKRWDYKGQ